MTDSPDLGALIEQWKAMPRGTNDERAAAERFYDEQVFPASLPTILEHSRPAFAHTDYDFEILTLGRSVHPIIISLLVANPREALLLCTTESLKEVTEAQAQVRKHGGRATIAYRVVDAEDPLTVYRAIREALADRLRSSVAVDITGGTKAMVGGAALAGALLEADLLYVSYGEYIEELRRPRPGAEHLVRLQNPYEVFGDLPEREALGLAARHQYQRAAEVLAELIDATAAHVRHEIERTVMEGYAALDAMDFAGGAPLLRDAAQMIERALRSGADQPFTAADQERLARQAEMAAALGAKLVAIEAGEATDLELLADRDLFSAIWSFIYAFALRQQTCGHLDTAGLCLYRCLELIPQRRLALRGLDAGRPDYSVLGVDASALEAAFAEAQPSGTDWQRSLPTWSIGALNGLRLLVALEDELASALGDGKRQIDMIARTFGHMRGRNQSIYAHGLRRLDAKTYTMFRGTVEEWAQALCEAEGRELDELLDAFRFAEFGPLMTDTGQGRSREQPPQA